MFFKKNYVFLVFFDEYLRVAAAHYGEAWLMRRGARSTPRGYAPLESCGNGCPRQPLQTFFYCDSHESQQRGKTKTFLINFHAKSGNFKQLFFSSHLTIFFASTTKKSLVDIWKWSHSNFSILIGHSTHYQTLLHLTINTYKNEGGVGWRAHKLYIGTEPPPPSPSWHVLMLLSVTCKVFSLVLLQSPSILLETLTLQPPSIWSFIVRVDGTSHLQLLLLLSACCRRFTQQLGLIVNNEYLY